MGSIFDTPDLKELSTVSNANVFLNGVAVCIAFFKAWVLWRLCWHFPFHIVLFNKNEDWKIIFFGHWFNLHIWFQRDKFCFDYFFTNKPTGNLIHDLDRPPAAPNGSTQRQAGSKLRMDKVKIQVKTEIWGFCSAGKKAWVWNMEERYWNMY